MNCEGCVHYRPFHGKPDSDEYECELGMEHAYECMSNGFDKKEDRLKPCPRCGSENLNVMTEHTSGKLTVHCVDCSQFYHNLELSMEMSTSEIFSKWNEYSKNYKQSEPKPDLKPCPFCGRTDGLEKHERYSIACRNCDIVVKRWGITIDHPDVDTTWNQRADDTLAIVNGWLDDERYSCDLSKEE